MADVLVYDEIGEGFAAGLSKQLKAAGRNEVTIYINSPGGFMHEGVAAFNQIQRHPAPVHTQIDGAAFSAASLIAIAGTGTRRMAENALMLIHDPWIPFVEGRIDNLRKTLDYLSKTKRQAVQMYARQSKLTNDEVSGKMTEEWFLDSAEALEHGLVSEIGEPQNVQLKAPIGVLNEAKVKEWLARRRVPLDMAVVRQRLADLRQGSQRFLLGAE